MLIDFIAMACVGAAMAGIFLALRKILKERLPKWALPAVIGAGMLSYSVWSEYSWYSRVAAALPEQVTILAAPRDTSPMRPWTYIAPPITRFMALDGTVLRTSTENATIKQGEIMLVQRWHKTNRVAVGFDCAQWRHADLVDGATLSPAGDLTGSFWLEAAKDDPLMLAACPAA